jgi:hypothetical protein
MRLLAHKFSLDSSATRPRSRRHVAQSRRRLLARGPIAANSHLLRSPPIRLCVIPRRAFALGEIEDLTIADATDADNAAETARRSEKLQS